MTRMKAKTWLLGALALVMMLSLCLIVPSGAMLGEARAAYERDETVGEDEGEEEAFDLFPISGTGSASSSSEAPEVARSLPEDFTAGFKPNPDAFTDEGYQDDSLTVRMETIKSDGVVYRVAHVQIAHASQLRTAVAGPNGSSRVATTSVQAKRNNAVVAINGDYYAYRTGGFVIRQFDVFRNKLSKKLDLLLIDEKGDFHLFLKSDAVALTAFTETGLRAANAFTFGPALVVDGQVRDIPDDYTFAPLYENPRTAIGQVGELSYVMVIAEGRNNNSTGATLQALANFMGELGCTQAFNLDGGGSSTMVFNGEFYNLKTAKMERGISDIIYFATAVPEDEWR